MSKTTQPTTTQPTTTSRRGFSVGDRVALIKNNPGAVFPRTHGIIVRRHGEHDPETPRVRWEDGWGVNMDADQLRLLTPAELKQPLPTLYNGDSL